MANKGPCLAFITVCCSDDKLSLFPQYFYFSRKFICMSDVKLCLQLMSIFRICFNILEFIAEQHLQAVSRYHRKKIQERVYRRIFI
jgi:hypothetical protein